MSRTVFWATCAAALACAYGLTRVVGNDYVFFAAYVIVQFVLIATAWNIAGGYAGYVNFGTAGFFGAGAYTAVAVDKIFGPSLGLQILCAAVVGGCLSIAIAYLSIRLRGIYFSIATVAVAVVIESVVLNTSFVGGSRGLSLVQPPSPAGFSSYTAYLFVVITALAILGVAVARTVERSRFGRGLAAIRDNEGAAEACGVPTLLLKTAALTVSGMLMAAAGAPFAIYASHIDPGSAFNMNISLAALAMPLLGGTSTWVGPVVGALVLATAQQALSIFASSQMNLLVLGLILVLSVVLLPGGAYAAARRLGRSA